ncbi:MAG: hypothetical protein ACKOKF_00005 [Bacteroidota bacterium]
MHPVLRKILAVVAGIFCGGFLNSTLLKIGQRIYPLPQGANMSSFEQIKVSMPLLMTENFVTVFLAHALGTFFGAFVAAKIYKEYGFRCAMIVSYFFLIGGIIMVVAVGGPIAFILTDLFFAYLPMGWLGYRFSKPITAQQPD